ncbi:hypothetical protein RB195_023083 [Necator americanus]|uniref:Uncharacterized protein n=1 Tax=Necator americanus TaxID=51031 RepID=A0ABR1EHR3_NECAM
MVWLTFPNGSAIRVGKSFCDKLQENISKQQADFVCVSEENRTKEEKIQELEAELKRIRNEHLKLETKRFNEVLDLKHRLDAMQKSYPFAPSVPGYDLLNQSVSPVKKDSVPSHVMLWEEAPRAISRSCATSPEEDFLLETLPFAKRGSSRSRRSDRLANDVDRRKEKKESAYRRVRSRSHGRQVWSGEHTPRFTELPKSCSSHGLDLNALHHQYNRSSHMYYSSGGSNGGRSPPPEIPLLSAVPPPGVKKPMGKRVVDANFDIK